MPSNPIVNKTVGSPEYVPRLKERTVGRDSLLSEGFEGYDPGMPPSIPPDWWQWHYSGSTDWVSTSDSYAGDGAVEFSGYGYGDVTFLFTPTLNSTAGSNNTLEFWHKQPAWGGDQDYLEIWVLNASSYMVYQLTGWYSDIPSYTHESLDLNYLWSLYWESSYGPFPSQFAVAFRGEEHWGYGVHVDEVYVNNTLGNLLYTGFDGIPASGFPPANWTMEVVNQPGYTAPEWSAVSSGTYPSCSPHSGSYMTKFNSFSCTHDSSARLYTYKVDFTNYMNCKLTFWMYHDSGYSSSDDKVVIQVSLDGTTWTNITEFLRYNASSPGWVEHTVDLSAYDNTDPYIAFLGVSDYGNNMYIDDIEVTGTPVQPLIANAHGPYHGYVNATIQFYGSATGGVSPYSWHWNFGDGNTSNQQNPTHVYTSPGNYTVTLNVTDAWGNWSIDTTTAVIEEIAGSWVTTHTPIWINGTDVGSCPSGIKEIHYIITYPDNTTHEFVVPGDTANFTFTEECMHKLEFWSVDNLGHESEHTIQIHYVDDTPPTTSRTFDGPYCTDGLNIWIRTNTTIILTAEDGPACGPSGVKEIWYNYGDGWNVVAGNTASFNIPNECHHTLQYYAVDNLGNTEAMHSVEINVDDSPPATTLTYGTPYYTDGVDEWITTSTPITLTAVDYPDCASGVVATYYRINGGTWQTYTGPFTIPDECTHTIEYYSVDCIGNEEPHHLITVHVDSSPPVTTLTFGTPYHYDGNNWITTSTPIYLSAVDYPDCACGVNHTYYRIITSSYTTIWYEYTGPFTIPEECEHTIEYYSIDHIGNVENVNSIVVYVDNSPPEMGVVVGEPSVQSGEKSYCVTSDTPIGITAWDTGCNGGVGVDTIYYRIWHNGWSAWATYLGGTMTLPEEGLYYIEINAIDYLGNSGYDNFIFIVDNTPPNSWMTMEMYYHEQYITPWTEFSIYADEQGNCSACGYIIHFAISGPEGSKFYYFSNYYNCNGTWHTGFNNTPVSFQIRNEEGYAPPGVYTVKFYAVDSLGNTGDIITETFRIDVSPPETTISLDGPSYEEWISPNTQIALISQDGGSGTMVTKYRIDNGPEKEYTEPFTLSNGMHIIHYYSIDNMGNKESEHTATLYVDANSPDSQISFNGKYVSGKTTWITKDTLIVLQANDVGCGLKAIYYRIDGGDWNEYSTPITLNNGIHKIEYYGMDNVENKESVKTINVGIDTSPPQITIDTPKPSYIYILGRQVLPLPGFMHTDAVVIGSVKIKASASDECGISDMKLYIDNKLVNEGSSIDYNWNELSFTRHVIKVEAKDKLGNEISKEMNVLLINFGIEPTKS